MKLSDEQIERYSRQIILNEVGGKGQAKLLDSKVLVIGCGGLGSPAAFYLAAAGVGSIGLVDSDSVELNNLQRQILYSIGNIGEPKVVSAKEKLNILNPGVKVQTHQIRIDSSNIKDIIKEFDFILDCSDNFPTRYLVNDACVLEKKPFSYAGVLGFEGQAITIFPGKSSCYRCLFPEPPPPGTVPSCQEAGIIGSVAALLGTIQSMEAIKYILGIGQALTDKLLVINTLEWTFQKLNIKRNNKCSLCGDNPTVTELIDYEIFCGIKRKDVKD